jgi:ribosomal-protein-alanine N-acetyltransferase
MSSFNPTPAPHHFRAMTVADTDRVMALELQAYPFPWSPGHFTDSLAAGYEAQLLLAGSVSRRGEAELLGYYIAMPGVEELHLLNLTVAPAHQGRGWAHVLLSHLADAGQRQGARQLWLEVRESNSRARQLYERWGFDAVGLRKSYYPAAHGQREHALVMRSALPARNPGTAHGMV